MRPTVTPLLLARLTLPPSHPRSGDGGTAPVYGYAVRHADGVLLFDTGVGADNDFIDELYHPDVTDVADALNAAGIDERDVTAIANSHLHFDHCGQNHALEVPVWCRDDELAAAAEPWFTVPEWAELSEARRRMARGDEVVAEGLTLVETPGHTPGHQSLVVEYDGVVELVAGQPCWTCAEFEAGRVDGADAHGPEWHTTAEASLARLRAMEPVTVWLGHDLPTGDA